MKFPTVLRFNAVRYVAESLMPIVRYVNSY